MCGIVGYVGKEIEVSKVAIKALKRLEYRGYDSAGIAFKKNNIVEIRKNKGKIDSIKELIFNHKESSFIAHTRWATHGAPNQINAHPHADCKNTLAIVHNGIIENYSSLKEILIKEGHKFKSETDSEVIAHLIEKFYEGDFIEAFKKALMLLEGAYAIVALHRDHDFLLATRKGSPLVIGIKDKEKFVASDVAAFLEYTKKVIYLEDNEIALLAKDKVKVFHKDKAITKEIQQVEWNLEQLEKKGYKHFMLKEIMEQPEAVENTLRGRLKKRIKISVNVPEKINKIIIIGCGTSWHAALVGKYIIESLTRIPVEVDYASEFRYRNPIINKDDLLVVISQSGETIDSLFALKLAKEKGAKTLGIVNVVGSTIAREVDSGIYLHAGPEIGVASTKAFTCQIAALTLLALYLNEKINKVDWKIKSFKQELKKIPEKIEEILKNHKKIKKIAEKFKDAKNFLFLARGINFPTALEGALKLKEISYIHAEGYPAGEMKHGPIALVDENVPSIFIAIKGKDHKKILNNMQEIKARKGKIIAIATKKDDEIKKFADYLIYIPKTIEELSPMLTVIPLQLLAYHIADLKGCDVDKPRNLAKSVTVE
ncbi:MAG: glutamine--fructose-6-phosphate transaminase (isomerizing) [Candidatus Pacearchaeota archaeon]